MQDVEKVDALILYLDSDSSAIHTCTHVWIGCYAQKSPLNPRYSDPYQVIQQSDKVFTLGVKDSHKTASIDRLKVAYLPQDPVMDPSPSASLPREKQTIRGRKIHLPSYLKDYNLA